MNKRQVNIMIAAFFATIIGAIIIFFLIWQVIIPWVQGLQFNNNRDVVEYHAHHGLNPDIPSMLMDGQRISDFTPWVTDDGNVYLPADFMTEFIDPFLFWDNNEGIFFASTRYEMLEFSVGQRHYSVNGEIRQLTDPIIRNESSPTTTKIYMPVSLIEGLYPLVVEFFAESNIVALTSATLPQTRAVVTAATGNVRARPDSRSPIIARLSAGDELLIFMGEDNTPMQFTTMPDDLEFVPVRTPYGMLGYIAVSDIGEITSSIKANPGVPGSIANRPRLLANWIDNLEQHPPNWPEGRRINMLWELVYHPDANAVRMQTPLHRSLTVISPTWFRFDGENLRINSVASQAYVDWAHEQGVQVWPLVFDVNNATARAILMNREARRTVVNQLVHYVDQLGVDGINIDIEHLFAAEEGPYKIQFLRELAIPMRQRDIVLSAAVKVPEAWSMFYRRDLIGLTVDFVQVMTYDEHWATSPTAGPNASLPWVQNAITNMLREVPKEKLMMGIPFYSRIWREVAIGDEPPTSMARGVDATRSFFEERGVVWEWDDIVGSYFGEVVVTEDGQTVFYRVWLEDERSISTKMHIYNAHDLAGVASWVRGLESPGVWDVLGSHFP